MNEPITKLTDTTRIYIGPAGHVILTDRKDKSEFVLCNDEVDILLKAIAEHQANTGQGMPHAVFTTRPPDWGNYLVLVTDVFGTSWVIREYFSEHWILEDGERDIVCWAYLPTVEEEQCLAK